MTDRSDDEGTDWSRVPTTGADFAASFARSFPISPDGSNQLAGWFDLAIDAGRRQARAAGAGRVNLRAALDVAEQTGATDPDIAHTLTAGGIYRIIAAYRLTG